MNELDNPAGRLLSIINEGIGKPGNSQAAEIWADLLSVPTQDKSLLLNRVGHVMALPSQIRAKFAELRNLDPKIYLKWLPDVEASFGLLNFQIPWKQFIEKYDKSVIYGMEICSDLLSRECPEQVAEENLLSKLKEQLEELLDSIDSETLDEDLRKFIYENLMAVKIAVDEYRIRGIGPLQREFQSIFGFAVLNPELYKKSQTSSFGRKFWKFMGKLAMVTTVTVGAIQIGKETISLLPSPENQVESSIAEDVKPKDENGKEDTKGQK